MTTRGFVLHALTGLVVVGGAVVASVAGSPPAASGASPEHEKAERSSALTQTPPSADTAAYAGGAARSAADRLAPALPLPEGGNFSGIRFEELNGTISGQQIEFVLTYNAACQWHRALRDGRESDAAAHIVHDIARWPGVRNTPAGPALSRAAAEADRGGGAVLRLLREECDALHARELSYASGRGTICLRTWDAAELLIVAAPGAAAPGAASLKEPLTLHLLGAGTAGRTPSHWRRRATLSKLHARCRPTILASSARDSERWLPACSSTAGPRVERRCGVRGPRHRTWS